MHDTNLEDRLRTVLRAEGDGLSLTITTDELERRLALRRRARNGQRISLMAAGLAALAVGTMFALSNGWLRGTTVATDPSPSPAGSTTPSAAAETPAPSPTPRIANPVGSVDEAVLVTPIGADSRRPDAFEVTTFHPRTGIAVLLATIPGSVIPDDGWIDLDGPPQISETGWLAIPFTRGPNEDQISPAIAIVDIRAPDASPWILDGYTSMAWDLTDKLVVEREGRVSIAWPMSRELQPFQVAGPAHVAFSGHGVTSGPAVAVQEGARFLAVVEGDVPTWGYLGFDGAFTPTDDLPPVYQRTGLERPAGVGAHGLGQACDSGGPSGGGCWIVETDAKGAPVAPWIDTDKTLAHDFTWAVDGKSVWMLLDGGTTGGTTIATLVYAPDVDTQDERGRVDVADGIRPQILGIADEHAAGSPSVVAIGDDDGIALAFVLADGTVVTPDGTAWFAGWAVDPPAYDPD